MIDAYNELCTIQSVSSNHYYLIDALNAINVGGGGTSERFELPALVQLGAQLNLLPQKITDWQGAGSDVYVAGQPVNRWGRNFFMPDIGAPPAGGCVILEKGHALRQNCIIKSISFDVYYRDGSADWEFKLFRWNGTDYTCIASQPFNFTGTGNISAVKTVTLTTPIAALEGDIPGLYLPFYSCLFCTPDVPSTGVAKEKPYTKRNVAGNIALNATNAFTEKAPSAADPNYYFAPLTLFSNRPYSVHIGDSINGGGNSNTYPSDGSNWNTDQESVDVLRTPGGAAAADKNLSVPYRISTRMPDGYQYQNFAMSGTTFEFIVKSNAILSRALLADSKIFHIHCGVNDVFYSRSWAQIEADLDTIRAAVPAGVEVYLDEILAFYGTDPQAAAIRTYNANYAAYCTSHDWTLVPCHDAMATVRPSTGLLDDLNPIYSNGDSVHLNAAGVDKLASLVYAKIKKT